MVRNRVMMDTSFCPLATHLSLSRECLVLVFGYSSHPCQVAGRPSSPSQRRRWAYCAYVFRLVFFYFFINRPSSCWLCKWSLLLLWLTFVDRKIVFSCMITRFTHIMSSSLCFGSCVILHTVAVVGWNEPMSLLYIYYGRSSLFEVAILSNKWPRLG